MGFFPDLRIVRTSFSTFSYFFLFFPISYFAGVFQHIKTARGVRSQMKKPEEMSLALRDSILFTVVLYEIIMIWGYAAYGQKLKENLIETISAIFPLFCMLPSSGALANVAITAPLFFYCFFSAIEATGNFG